jgi:DNA-binding PadR family transcriptional regulator
MDRWETQPRKGVVELAVLATIARGETYGYRIVEQLQRLGGLELTEADERK